jgi:hypothetical protein
MRQKFYWEPGSRERKALPSGCRETAHKRWFEQQYWTLFLLWHNAAWIHDLILTFCSDIRIWSPIEAVSHPIIESTATLLQKPQELAQDVTVSESWDPNACVIFIYCNYELTHISHFFRKRKQWKEKKCQYHCLQSVLSQIGKQNSNLAAALVASMPRTDIRSGTKQNMSSFLTCVWNLATGLITWYMRERERERGGGERTHKAPHVSVHNGWYCCWMNTA